MFGGIFFLCLSLGCVLVVIYGFRKYLKPDNKALNLLLLMWVAGGFWGISVGILMFDTFPDKGYIPTVSIGLFHGVAALVVYMLRRDK